MNQRSIFVDRMDLHRRSCRAFSASKMVNSRMIVGILSQLV